MLISLPLAVLAAAMLIFINEASFQQSSTAVVSLEEAQQARSAINSLVRQILDAETGQRGYLLTGDERYLQPYDMTSKNVNQNLDVLRQLFSTYPDQLSDFDLMSRHILRKLAEMDLSVRMRKQGNENGWKFVLTTDVGKEQMDAIRNLSAKLSAGNIKAQGTCRAAELRC